MSSSSFSNTANSLEDKESSPPTNVGSPRLDVLQPKAAKTTIITDILSNDILLGRGALAISNEGNIRFRTIIAGRKDEYISTSRRLKKDTIANEIRALIVSRKGRFLRRATLEEKLEIDMAKGKDAWAVADEEVVVAKIKQSLRDKEPDEREMMEQSSKRAHETSFDEAKRARLRGGPPALDWNEPQIATDRPLQSMMSSRGHFQEDSTRAPGAQQRSLEEELLELRERQRMLLERSHMSEGDLPGGLDPSLARYRQLELLSGGGNTNLDALLLEQQRRLAGTAGDGSLQDSNRSSQSGLELEALRREMELRSQMETMLAQREEELLLRRLEQERDASLARLRRQEALLAAIRQGQPIPDLDNATLLRGGGGFLRDNNDLLGQESDLFTRRRQADLAELLGSRGMQMHNTLDPRSQSLLGTNSGTLRDDIQLDSTFRRKESFDHQNPKNGGSGNEK